jgi:hypothetical protein
MYLMYLRNRNLMADRFAVVAQNKCRSFVGQAKMKVGGGGGGGGEERNAGT